MIFREELAAAIIRGEKTATRRQLSMNPRSPWHVESSSYPVRKIFTINPGRAVGRVAECEVTHRALEPLAVLTPEQAREEGFRSVLAFRQAWCEINGTFNPKQLVHVVEFKLVGPYCMGCDGTGWCEGSPAFDCPDCFATGIEVSGAAHSLVAKLETERERVAA